MNRCECGKEIQLGRMRIEPDTTRCASCARKYSNLLHQVRRECEEGQVWLKRDEMMKSYFDKKYE